jgi:hypothetical protein
VLREILRKITTMQSTSGVLVFLLLRYLDRLGFISHIKEQWSTVCDCWSGLESIVSATLMPQWPEPCPHYVGLRRLAEGHTVWKWQSWDLNLGRLASSTTPSASLLQVVRSLQNLNVCSRGTEEQQATTKARLCHLPTLELPSVM